MVPGTLTVWAEGRDTNKENDKEVVSHFFSWKPKVFFVCLFFNLFFFLALIFTVISRYFDLSSLTRDRTHALNSESMES